MPSSRRTLTDLHPYPFRRQSVRVARSAHGPIFFGVLPNYVGEARFGSWFHANFDDNAPQVLLDMGVHMNIPKIYIEDISREQRSRKPQKGPIFRAKKRRSGSNHRKIKKQMMYVIAWIVHSIFGDGLFRVPLEEAWGGGWISVHVRREEGISISCIIS